MRRPVVAIDGPAGAGKTTVANRLAEACGLVRLDTGAMYRACALAAKRAGVQWSDAARLGPLCAGLEISLTADGGRVRVLLAGEDVSDAIRTPEMGMGASDVSVHPPVREAMVDLQRKIGMAGGIVAEGRDVGTVVFPDADAKFFLDAQSPVRARRRFIEWAEKPDRPSYETVLRDVLRRDIQDSTRGHSPLSVADDAVYVDSTVRTVDEVVEAMLGAMTPAVRALCGIGGGN